MRDKIYRIMKVANGWILEPYNYHPEFGQVISNDECYVFTSSKELAKFIKRLDDDEILTVGN